MTAFSLNTIKHAALSNAAYSKHIGAAILFGVLGSLVALFDGQTASETPNTTDRWTLPNTQPVTLSSSLNEILANPLFGGEPFIAEPQEPESVEAEEDAKEWRLIGIVTEGVQSRAIVQMGETGALQEAVMGDLLPGGEELISIGSNEIEMIQNDERVILSLFRDTHENEE